MPEVTSLFVSPQQRPELDYWGTGISALEYALALENELTTLLMELKTTASAKKERDVSC